MKMAAAEALYETESDCAGFSVFTIGTRDGRSEKFALKVPCVLSYLATGSFSGEVEGINPLAEELTAKYATGGALVSDATYIPNIPISYWSFRWMMGCGFVTMGMAALVLWATRKPGAVLTSKRWTWVAVGAPLLPVFANSFGWIFTEIGRQPWIVNGLMTTSSGVSPSVSTGEVLTSMVVYTLVYAVLAVIEVKLFTDYVKRGADPFEEPHAFADDDSTPLQFAY